MGNQVAVEGDVQVTPGSTYLNATGTWKVDSLKYASYSQFKVGGKAVIYQADCQLSFEGVDNASPPKKVTGREGVTLKAKRRKLQGSSTYVLVNNDSITSPHGNQLKVVAQQKLTTG